jgi:hypothetical protein
MTPVVAAFLAAYESRGHQTVHQAAGIAAALAHQQGPESGHAERLPLREEPQHLGLCGCLAQGSQPLGELAISLTLRGQDEEADFFGRLHRAALPGSIDDRTTLHDTYPLDRLHVAWPGRYMSCNLMTRHRKW